MPFKLNKSSSHTTESPETLFLDLRSRKVPGLLAHQADILREYTDKAVGSSDVAFQLPTGSGKTLVGLLIAEWRRRKLSERVIYLCPTNQLVYQVVDQARNKYGLKATAFTGKKSEYEQREKSEYLAAETIAVTSYSGLFNTNPFFTDPQLIILDDAHSSENYIASQWSVRVERYRQEHSALFAALTSILRPVLPITDLQKLTGHEESPWDKMWVDKIPSSTLYGLIPELVGTIDAYATGLDLRFPWRLIRDHLHACHLYISTREILIRPLLPPTDTHEPFAGAKQRVYMSATLGEGGELERLTGRKSITRLHIPAGYDKQSVGRRLFFFPGRSLDETQAQTLTLSMIRSTGRALAIVPDDQSATEIKGVIEDQLGFTTFDARQIEQSKTPFISNAQAVAVVANRYDGIDFPDQECRLLILEGVPRATNLQERFLVTRMGAAALLNDRILTRFQQASGRCTRSATDFASVVILGDELLTFLLKQENRHFLHPELQAELQFGIEQSKDVEVSDFLDNLRIFLAHEEEWAAADDEIVSVRQDLSQKQSPGTEHLREAVEHEVNYQYAMWYAKFDEALEHSRKVLSVLTHPELRGYRALWNYLAGSAAWFAYKDGISGLDAVAREHFGNALSASQGIRWLVGLSQVGQPDAEALYTDRGSLVLVERMEAVLDGLGVMNERKYAKEEQFILENLFESDNTKFEAAQEHLGRLLGYQAGNKESTGAPDPWWIVNEQLCFVFEDHSDANSESILDVKKARQAASHPNWIRDNLNLSPDASVLPVLVTPVKVAHPDALPHLRGVYLWPIDEFRAWAQNALTVIRELRRSFSGSGNLVWRTMAVEKYIENGLDPESVVEMLSTKSASQLLKR
jgi:hypothetical protein